MRYYIVLHVKVQHENSMIQDHKKLHQSSIHYERKLLRKYWLQWRIWMAQERQAQELASNQTSVRQKMSAFLAAGKQMAREQREGEASTSVGSRSVASRLARSHVVSRNNVTTEHL